MDRDLAADAVINEAVLEMTEAEESAWRESPAPFGALDSLNTFEARFIEDEVDLHRQSGLDVRVGRVNLAWMLEFDRDLHEVGADRRLARYDWGSVDGLYEVGANCEDIALGRELAKTDPTFWPELRCLGPTPAMVSRANDLLAVAHRWHCAERGRRTSRQISLRRLHRSARARASHGSATRTRGSRRVASRSAGGGGPGDDSGESEPPPRRPLASLSAIGRANLLRSKAVAHV